MKVVYANDTGLGAGYGLFRVSGIDGTAMHSDGAKATRFVVRRSSDGKYLGRSGWQDAEEALVPDEVTPDSETGGLMLAVSPHVVNQLDELETCRFSLLQGESTLGLCVLQLSGIMYGHMAAGGAVQGAPLVAAMPPPSPVQPAPAQVPEPEPEPVLPQPAHGPEQLPDLEPATPKKGNMGLIAALLLVLAFAGAGVWWYVQGKATPESAPLADAPPPAKTEPAAPAPAAPAVDPAPAPAVQKSPKETVSEFVRKGGTPPEALALSSTLSAENSGGQDAVFLLLEIAAEGGQPEAMLRVAQYYDPLHTAPAGTLQKDPEQAWLWYGKAASSGEAATTGAAQSALDKLRQWLSQEATQGSAAAKSLLERVAP